MFRHGMALGQGPVCLGRACHGTSPRPRVSRHDMPWHAVAVDQGTMPRHGMALARGIVCLSIAWHGMEKHYVEAPCV